MAVEGYSNNIPMLPSSDALVPDEVSWILECNNALIWGWSILVQQLSSPLNEHCVIPITYPTSTS